MNEIWLIIAMTGIIYTLRVSGLFSQGITVPDLVERALGFVPVAILSALVVSGLANQSSDSPRLLAAAGAGAIMYLTGRMWACILGGFGLYWVLRLLIG